MPFTGANRNTRQSMKILVRRLAQLLPPCVVSPLWKAHLVQWKEKARTSVGELAMCNGPTILCLKTL